MDFTGRFETLPDDFARVAQRLGCPPELPHRNPSRHRRWQDYYTPETERIVGEIYSKDIELFGY